MNKREKKPNPQKLETANRKEWARLLENEKEKNQKEDEITLLPWIRKIGTQIAASLNWRLDGAKIDGEEKRMERDWENAEKKVDTILSGKSIQDIPNILKEYMGMQAQLFWMFRKERGENHRTADDDYHDAKRYIGYLISERLIERCLKKKNKDPNECYIHLRNEFIEYLITLSVEEFIRIKSYFLWGKENAWKPFCTQKEANHVYFVVQDILEYSQRNCNNKKPDQILQYIPDDAKSYFINKESIEIEKIINAKIYANGRLNICHPKKISEYTHFLYPEIKIALQGKEWKKENAATIIRFMYRSNDIPNMLEYFLRCFICAHLKDNDHADIRQKFGRPIWTPDIQKTVDRVFS